MIDNTDKENELVIEGKWHKPQRSGVTFCETVGGYSSDLGDTMRSRKTSDLASRE